MKDKQINTTEKIKNDDQQRLPHERDESPDGQDIKPRTVGKQAAADVDSGMVDTDARNKPGVEHVKTPVPRDATARPQPNTKRD